MFRLKKQFYGTIKSHNDIFEKFFVNDEGKTFTVEDEAPPEDFPGPGQIIWAAEWGGFGETSCVVLYLAAAKLWLVKAEEFNADRYWGQWKPRVVNWFEVWKQNLAATMPQGEVQQSFTLTCGNNVIMPVDVLGYNAEDPRRLDVSTDTRGMAREQYFMLVPATLLDATNPDGSKEQL